MSKFLVSLNTESTSAVANPYLAADGMIDVAAYAKLNTRIEAANKKAVAAQKALPNSAAAAKAPKAATPYVYTAKPVPRYSAALSTKGDHRYLLLRGQQVKTRTRLPVAGSKLKFTPILTALLVATGETADKVLLNDVKKALVAATRANAKAEKAVGKVKVEKGKLRDEANAAFDNAVSVLKTKLTGLKETDVVEAQGMMGKTVIIRLGPDAYVSIGKADKTRFLAAVRAAKAAAE